MREIKKIVIHCDASDRPEDGIQALLKLHTSPPHQEVMWDGKLVPGFAFDTYGYHFYVDKEGTVHKMRSIEYMGAHVKGENHDSVAICLKGKHDFNIKQFHAAANLIADLAAEYDLDIQKDVYPHNHFTDQKTCPNFPIEKIFQFFSFDEEDEEEDDEYTVFERLDDIEKNLSKLSQEVVDLRLISKAHDAHLSLIEEKISVKKPWWKFW